MAEVLLVTWFYLLSVLFLSVLVMAILTAVEPGDERERPPNPGQPGG